MRCLFDYSSVFISAFSCYFCWRGGRVIQFRSRIEFNEGYTALRDNYASFNRMIFMVWVWPLRRFRK